jgi:hypothetical protein
VERKGVEGEGEEEEQVSIIIFMSFLFYFLLKGNSIQWSMKVMLANGEHLRDKLEKFNIKVCKM